MEPTYARQVFPCYDEPALKANFTLHIIRPENFTSIANTPLVNRLPLDNGKVQDSFAETVKMSTYLVAFVVSEMTSVNRSNQRVFAAPELIADGRGEYGLQAGLDILAVLEDYTGIDYSLEKLDQVAIPDDYFTFGAMENWGLVTYRNRLLLWKEGISTAGEKQGVASIVAHELAHQWFGNLVSPLWWEYIWLNEGFATYFEYYATSRVATDMRLMEQYIVDSHQNALQADSELNTRPMTYNAQTPSEIMALFDTIAYDKAGSVILMLEHFLTSEIFKRGLFIYLNNLAYQAAEPKDLWDGLQAAVNEINPNIFTFNTTVEEIMRTWSDQAGVPVVKVEKVEGRLVLSQERFLYPTNATFNTVWTIPINFATATNPDFTNTSAAYWLRTARENTDIPIGEDEWVILNKQSIGYYRVEYDLDNWNLIIEQLKSANFGGISVLNRAQLVDDALNLARAGRLDYNVALDLLSYLSQETDYIPLYSFFRGLTFLNRLLLHKEEFNKLQAFVRDILQAAYEDLGTSDTGSHTDRLNRVNVLTWLCRYDHEDCISAMHEATSTIPATPDQQTLVYCSGLIDDTNIEQKWNNLYQRYVNPSTEYLEINRIVSSFGCTRSVYHLIRLLNMIVDREENYKLLNSHKVSAFSGIVSSSKIGVDTALDFLLDNFDHIRANLTSGQISSIISGLADRLTTAEQGQRLNTFFETLSAEAKILYANDFISAAARIMNNFLWVERNIGYIDYWLNEQGYGSGIIFGVSLPLLLITVMMHFVGLLT